MQVVAVIVAGHSSVKTWCSIWLCDETTPVLPPFSGKLQWERPVPASSLRIQEPLLPVSWCSSPWNPSTVPRNAHEPHRPPGASCTSASDSRYSHGSPGRHSRSQEPLLLSWSTNRSPRCPCTCKSGRIHLPPPQQTELVCQTAGHHDQHST